MIKMNFFSKKSAPKAAAKQTQKPEGWIAGERPAVTAPAKTATRSQRMVNPQAAEIQKQLAAIRNEIEHIKLQRSNAEMRAEIAELKAKMQSSRFSENPDQPHSSYEFFRSQGLTDAAARVKAAELDKQKKAEADELAQIRRMIDLSNENFNQ